MAKSTRELFELLRTGPDAEVKKKATGGRPGRRARREGPAPRAKAAPGGYGRRRVPGSLKGLLFFVAAFLLTNVLSYMVGKWQGARTEVPLTTNLERFWAVQVTPLLDESAREKAWDLRDLLIDEGYEGAEVLLHTVRKKTYVRVIAAKYRYESRARARPLTAELEGRVGELARAGKLPRGLPVEVKEIMITYVKNGRSGEARE